MASNLKGTYPLSTFDSEIIFKLILNTIPRPLLIKMSFLARPFLKIFLRGNNFTDPIDGKSFRKFLPYGYQNQRPNALSPSSLSLERHRLLWLYLKKETDFFINPKKVLHFAPEQAFYKHLKKLTHLNYTTTDLKSPLADIKADICALPFDTDSFDVILCNHVLEHIKEDNRAMCELYRVLKPGGLAIVQVPIDLDRTITFEDDSIVDKAERTKYFGQYDHVRVYGKDYFDKLKSVGFEVEAVDFTKKLTPEECKRYALVMGELIPIARKPKIEENH
jgi:predicted SAM-dependent methyltransferase